MELGTNFSAKLEPFLLMSKAAKGAAAAKLIQDATTAPGIFVFAELLDLPNIQELASSEQHASSYSLLQLFSYKTYPDYLANKDSLPSLNQAQITKLKQLTLVTLATDSRILPYSQLLEVLQMPTIRELEDLIIDAVYLEIVRGKLDQKEQQFEVEYTMGRDLEPGKIEQLLASLQNWASTTSAVLASLDEKLAAMSKDKVTKKQQTEVYEEVYNKNLKEILDKQKEIKANLRAAAYPGRTGLTAAGRAELERERERERQREAERAAKEAEDRMDVDEPENKGKNRKAPPGQPDAGQRSQKKRSRV